MSARSLALLAALLVAAPAAAFEQTRDAKTLKGLHWTNPTVPWFLNTCRPSSSPSCRASATDDPAAAAVQAAFTTWQGATRSGETDACTGIALPFAGSSTSVAIGTNTVSQHLVVFRQGWCSSNPDAVADSCFDAGTCDSKYNCFDDVNGGMSRNVLALTTVIYAPSTGEIADADMEVVDWGGLAGSLRSLQNGPSDGWYWTCFDPTSAATCNSYGEDGCGYMDLQNTVTHEVGHFIGLAHPCEAERGDCTAAMAPTTMFPSAAVREIAKRTLEADDVEGVCTIYPRTAVAALTAPAPEVRTVAASVSADTAYQCVPKPAASPQSSRGGSGGCGAGSATPVGLAALALALALLLPRRRVAVDR